jgi:hypothetical protein
VDGRLSSFQKKSHQIHFTKKVLNPVFYKIDFGVFKFNLFFIKTKTQFMKVNDFLKKIQHSYKSFNKNFLDQHDIKVALINMIVFWLFNMIFGLFDYYCAL